MRPARDWRGSSILTALAIYILTASGGAAFAKCGDQAGDNDAVAATREKVNSMCDCDQALSHGEYTKCAADVVRGAISDKSLPPTCASKVIGCARKSSCGRPAFVPCCRVSASGATHCSMTKDLFACGRRGGCYSLGAKSCCDACTNTGMCVQSTPTPTSTPRPTMTPPGFCQSLGSVPAGIHVPVNSLPGTSECGGAGFMPPAEMPFSGSVIDSNGNSLADLGLGCLYAGVTPPSALSSGSARVLDVTGVNLPTIILGGSAGSGPTDCTKGAGPGMHCVGKNAGTACSTDDDCHGGSCLLDPNCYFGPPGPVPGAFPACTIEVLQKDMCGSLNLSTTQTSFFVDIQTRTYVTGDATNPCPLCMNGACTAGQNVGMPCTPLGNFNTSLDCPPKDGQFVAAFEVVIPELTTGTSTLDADQFGAFCQNTHYLGAFGLSEAREITQTGQGAMPNGTTLETTLVSSFCIDQSGNPIIDGSGGFPAAGTVSSKGSIDLTNVILNGLIP